MVELIYTEYFPYGKIYYDPLSHRGVRFSEEKRIPVILLPEEGYNPFLKDPDSIAFGLVEGTFKDFFNAAIRRDKKSIDEIIEKHFPAGVRIKEKDN